MSEATDLSDRALLRRYHDADDQQAFACLVERYQEFLYHWLKKQLGDGDHAWDVLQQVWLQCLRHRRRSMTAGQDSSGKGWLFQVARYRVRDSYRERRARQVLPLSQVLWREEETSEELYPLSLADLTAQPEEIAQQQVIWQEIGRLSEKERRVLYFLTSGKHMTYLEISRHSGIPAGTIKTIIFRVRPRLRASLHAWMEPEKAQGAACAALY